MIGWFSGLADCEPSVTCEIHGCRDRVQFRLWRDRFPWADEPLGKGIGIPVDICGTHRKLWSVLFPKTFDHVVGVERIR